MVAGYNNIKIGRKKKDLKMCQTSGKGITGKMVYANQMDEEKREKVEQRKVDKQRDGEKERKTRYIQ